MSSLIVEVCEIKEIEKHENADNLEIATVKGWKTIIQKGSYTKGDKVVYAPVDSVLPQKLSDDMNVTKYLSNGRIRAAKLRGLYSMGLLIPMKYVDKELDLGTDVKDILGITKYEPPVKVTMGGDALPENPKFVKYTGIENIKNFPDEISEGEEVVVNEKLHGTNARFAKFDGKLLVGSHNINLKESDKNIYWQIAREWRLEDKLQEGEELFGEIIGKGVQNLTYGQEKQSVRFFDLFKNGKYVDYLDFKRYCYDNDLPHTPELYIGKWDSNLMSLANGKSTMATHIREGFVVKPVKERWSPACGRVILKHISEEYLLKAKDKYTH